MEHRHCNAYVRRPDRRRPFVLVEDDGFDLDVLDLSPPGADAFDVVVCTGPGADEVCPLVTEGACPFGRPDVVVHALDDLHPWSHSILAAWAEQDVPVAMQPAGAPPLRWPAHVGAAIVESFATRS